MVCRLKRTRVLFWLVLILNPAADIAAMAAAIPDEFISDGADLEREYEGSGDPGLAVKDRQVSDQAFSDEVLDETTSYQIQPVKLEIAAYTPREITLKWQLPLKGKDFVVTGHRIWHKHGSSYTDVKTIHSNKTSYTISGLSRTIKKFNGHMNRVFYISFFQALLPCTKFGSR